MPASSDRNLLFGILALQMNFITRDALITAMNTWVLDKAKSLGEILREHKALGSDDHAWLVAGVERHLALHGGDAEKSLAALNSVSSVSQALAQIADADVQASVNHIRGKPVDRPADIPANLSQAVGASTSAGLRFRILRPHARGGLGEVYVAHDEELHREVALKEIQNRHADNPERRKRFLLEAEITGGLEHPGIVPVYGLGQYADGRPFYAMRFVRGDSLKDAIERYHKNGREGIPNERRASANRVGQASSLDLRKLLGRFIDVCEAIQYAHDRGVLHRDLKPGNIMLGRYGETLVVDWGLAKATTEPRGRSTDSAALASTVDMPLRPKSLGGNSDTLPGTAIGTPAFMSPEQAAGRLDLLGPSTDVYSLGATLYNLLTGRPPIQDKEFEVIARRIAAADYPRPRQVRHDVDRALEAICLKAMALEPKDRYSSPRALAEDIEHWLADKPVSAWPEPWTVQARRWALEHRTLVTGTAAALLVGLVSLLIATALLTTANEQLAQKSNELANANNELAVKTEKALAAAKAQKEARDEAETSRAAEANHRKRAEDRETDALIAAKAEKAAKDAEIKQRHIAENREAVALNATRLANNRFEQIQKVNALLQSVFIDIDPLAEEKGGPILREQLTQRLLDVADKLDEETMDDPPTRIRLQYVLGNSLSHLGESGKAIKLLEKATRTAKELLGPDHPDTLSSMEILAGAYVADGKVALALPLMKETLEKRKATLVPDHPDTLVSMHDLAIAYHAVGKPDLALPLMKETLEKRKAKLGLDHRDTLMSMNSLAVAYHSEGKLDLALPLYQETLEKRKATLGPDHADTLQSMNRLAAAYTDARKPELAVPLYQETLEKRKAKLGPDHPATLRSMSGLAGAYFIADSLDLAVPLMKETMERMKAKLGLDHPETLTIMNNLAMAYRRAGKVDLAVPLFQETLDRKIALQGPDHPDTLTTKANLAKAYFETRQAAKALPLIEDVLAGRRKQWGENSPGYLNLLAAVATDALKYEQYTAAEPMLRNCLAIRLKTHPDFWRTFYTKAQLGASLLGQKKYDQAEPLLREGYEGMKQREKKTTTPQAVPTVIEALEWLVQLYEATGNAAEAGRYRKELAARKAGVKEPRK